MAPPCVFAVFWREGEHATTPWIFVNYSTSNATDLQHQNEYSVQALSSNMSSKLCLDTILSLTLMFCCPAPFPFSLPFQNKRNIQLFYGGEEDL